MSTPNDGRASMHFRCQFTCRIVLRDFLHEACPSCDHDILDIRQRFELRSSDEHWGLLPNPIALEELGVITICGDRRYQIS